MKKVAVFCGSSIGFSEVYKNDAIKLGNYFVENKIGLVYGGGKIGMMGVLADTILEHKGDVIGVIPKLLEKKEVIHPGVEEMIVCEKMSDRKVIMSKLVDAYITLPGGFGTLDELFEAITLIQTKKIGRFPIVLVGTEFWSGLLEWIKKTLIAQGNISEEDLKLFRIVDSAEEAVAHLNKFYSKYLLKPNF